MEHIVMMALQGIRLVCDPLLDAEYRYDPVHRRLSLSPHLSLVRVVDICESLTPVGR